MCRLPRALTAGPILLAALLAGCPAAEKKCQSGQTSCGGWCVDLATDPLNCGACGQSCGLGSCAGGLCACDAGATECPGAWPRCVDTANDPGNCSGCGLDCPLTNDVCVAGVCGCPGGLPEVCGSTCVDKTSDPRNCSGCGLACKPGAQCAASTCSCRPGYTDCGAACFNLATDALHCGGCTAPACATGATCVGGACDCPGATVVCGTAPGTCTDTTSDEQHCGSCTTVCATGATCVSSGCACPTGQTQVCGSAPGLCCAGSGCCAGGACKTAHSNGLGQSYYDCNPIGPPLTRDRAIAAAAAWRSTGTTVDQFCSGNCIYRQDVSQVPNKCATWCYDGNFAGQVSLNSNDSVCTCPPGGTFVGTWN